MAVALITGATSGIGLAISKKLIEKNYVVHGLARRIDDCDFSHERFVSTSCDLTDLALLDPGFGSVGTRPVKTAKIS